MEDGVDYGKMDVEGAERELLRGDAAWLRCVRSLGIEVHPPYTALECERDLERQGFRASTDHRGAFARVTAWRPEAA